MILKCKQFSKHCSFCSKHPQAIYYNIFINRDIYLLMSMKLTDTATNQDKNWFRCVTQTFSVNDVVLVKKINK